MSNAQFTEATSADPVERAIARRVTRILNDPTLDRTRREAEVKRAQRELLEHRRRQQRQAQLAQQMAAAQLPAGYQAQAAQVRDGRLQVAAFKQRTGYVWLDVGEAPSPIHTGD
ncbi:MAG: hypothetical protein JSS31_11455 [Proteobacteria bacterium]|nr:hypothetical protein [Pseudomonadota bacterium]MBS0494548.1 hypothetical protein [Pseudomonadota bacterium]